MTNLTTEYDKTKKQTHLVDTSGVLLVDPLRTKHNFEQRNILYKLANVSVITSPFQQMKITLLNRHMAFLNDCTNVLVRGFHKPVTIFKLFPMELKENAEL